MKITHKVISGILVAWLVMTGIVIVESTWAYGRWNTTPALGVQRQDTMQPGRGYGPSDTNTSQVRNTGTAIASIPFIPLSDAEKTALIYQYQEEMVARDLYTHFATLYPDTVFASIARSEQQHMDAVKVLLDRYSIATPVGYGDLRSAFDAYKVSGGTSAQTALEVGLEIEMLDIEDNAKTIKSSDNDDIRLVLAHIGGASYNHLRGFSRALTARWLTSSVDVSAYLTTEDLQTRGSLQQKFTDTLYAQGVTIPASPRSLHGWAQQMRHGGMMRWFSPVR